MEKTTRLVPPQTRNCQYYHSPAFHRHFDGAVTTSRCESVPTVILEQREPGPNGLRGAMAVCDVCLKIVAASLPLNYFTTLAISAEQQVRADSRKDRLRRGLTRAEHNAESQARVARVRVGPDLLITRERAQDAPRPLPKKQKVDHFDHLLNQRLARERDPFSEPDDDYSKLLGDL